MSWCQLSSFRREKQGEDNGLHSGLLVAGVIGVFCDKNGRVSRLGPGSEFPDCDLINYSFGENIEHELLQHIGAQVSRELCRDW